MLNITLPDGSVKPFQQPLTILELAQSISSSLAKSTIAGEVNGNLVDATYIINSDSTVKIITEKDEQGLDIIRHSTAHLLAYAVKRLYPDAQVTIGPTIDNGFYYDFSYKQGFTPEDLEKIEAEMHKIANEAHAVSREEWDRDEAVKYFHSIGEKYKAEIIASIPSNEKISLYKEGEFIDLCRGPHVPNTNKLKVFKLMKVAGAYWRGDSKNEMLQRIYGTAWIKQADQDNYLNMLAEAEKRDHRKLGKQLDLFHFQDEAPGLIFWHPKGWIVWQAIEQYMRQVYRENGYQEVKAPQILDRTLWEKSGHWDNYKDNMFTTESENRNYALKPMNCPGHVQIYNSGLHSYRELPIRYGEFGQCHRNESSGALHGLMRVRGFTQDDGHIFCTEEQIQEEVKTFNILVQQVYKNFGFEQVQVKLALRPEKRVGSDELWDKAENALHLALQSTNTKYEILEGEGAFYGPKIEFHIKDAIGRSWQCGTMQVDFSMPIRLGAEYATENNDRQIPVMLHRAILGSMERFIGILIENHAGNLPLWLSPQQIVLCTIAEAHVEYAKQVQQQLQKQGIRVHLDIRNEKINYKIREHTTNKIPYIAVIGEQEMQANSLNIRKRGNVSLGSIEVEQFMQKIIDEINAKV
ncbi:MAG: threonine--tRNA ligase [Pseudomonadota bacterium]|jgi:threonyl-tRNA synthetase